jgi:hypothetical protein
MLMAALPNTFLIGAASSGTTSLYDYLDRHMDVFMIPVKDSCDFAYAENPLAMTGSYDEPAGAAPRPFLFRLADHARRGNRR